MIIEYNIQKTAMAQSSASPSSSPSSSQKKANSDALKDWTQREKFHLLQGLKNCGRHDIQKIQEYVITKTVEETKVALEYYTEAARNHPMFEKQKEQKLKRSQPPLTDWAKLLTNNIDYKELRTETATAVRMIADNEDIPPKECTENIDFRQVYHNIANAMEGKPLTGDLHTAAVLRNCYIDTALSSKAFIKTAAFRHMINNIDLSDKETNAILQPTPDHELATLRHLASQRSHNPLNVPEELLKPLCPDDEK